jgi:hypothetical protein
MFRTGEDHTRDPENHRNEFDPGGLVNAVEEKLDDLLQ